MYILGIETSCDETAAAVVKDGRKILSNVVSSSLRFHKRYGGVVPEIASRMQLEAITTVVDSALEQAGVNLKAVGLIAATFGPGLPGSLLVGTSFARALSFALDVPLLGVNHVYAHLYANFLNGQDIKLPVVALVASGGHTSLFYIKNFKEIQTLGETQDDACGEAFDKVAKILRLGYPGGPIIEALAKKGNNKKIKFSCSKTKAPLNFSFSGIKTAVLYYAERHLCHPTSVIARRLPKAAGCEERSDEANSEPGIASAAFSSFATGSAIPERLLRSPIGSKGSLAMTKERSFGAGNDKRQLINDICASFQEAVVNALVSKSLLAARLKKAKRLVVGGGVAANNYLRQRFYKEAGLSAINCYFPPKSLCADNAAMVAGWGYQLYKKFRGHNT